MGRSDSIGEQAREDGETEEVEGGERLRLKEKSRQSEAPLCLPLWSVGSGPAEITTPTLLKPQASSKQPARGRCG